MENQNHVHVFEDIVVPATCRTTGHTLHRCACGHEYKDNYVPMTAHKFAVTEQTAPTCTQPGIQQLRCEICGDEKTQPLPALGHDWSQWNTQATPSCVTDGKQTRVCTRCGKVGERSIPATGHKLGKGQKSKAKRGYVKYTCEICGQTVEKKSASRKAVKWILLASVLALLVVVILGALPILKTFYHYKAAELHMENEEYADAYYHLIDCEKGLGKLYKNKSLKQLHESEIYTQVQDLLEDFVVISTATNYDADGVISGTTTAKYNQDKNTITYIDRDAYGEALSKKVNTYNKDGNKINYAYYTTDGYSCTYKYAYDKNGNLASETGYNADGEVTGKTEYTYNKDGSLASETRYNTDGEIIGKTKYTYNKDGNQTGYTYYDADENVIGKIKYTYDKKGLCTGHAEYNSDDEVRMKYKYTYDKDGNQTGYTIYTADSEVYWKFEHTYDKDGNRIKTKHYNADDKLIGTIEYDNFEVIYLATNSR